MQNCSKKLKVNQWGEVHLPCNVYVESSENVGINKLNDDCLIQIFMLLPFKDRIRIERVCKRWNRTAKLSWQNVKKLNSLDPKLWGFEVKKEFDTYFVLQAVVKRCCQSLTHIDLSEYLQSNHIDKFLRYVVVFCPLLQSINAISGNIWVYTLKLLIKHCRKLTEISFSRCTNRCTDELFSQLFKCNPKIRVVKIRGNYELTGKCLSDLSEDCLEGLVIDDCPKISLERVMNDLSNFKNLHTVLYKGFDIKPQTINVIPTKLKVLKIQSYNGNLDFITKMKCLQILDVSYCHTINDNFVFALVECCKDLLQINVQGCFKVSCKGIEKLSCLPKLIRLTKSKIYV